MHLKLSHFPESLFFFKWTQPLMHKKITQAVILIQPRVSGLRGHVSKNDKISDFRG